MEACHAEGSKSRCSSIPQIPVGQLAYQDCIRRDPIVAATSDESGQSFGRCASSEAGSRRGLGTMTDLLLRQAQASRAIYRDDIEIQEPLRQAGSDAAEIRTG